MSEPGFLLDSNIVVWLDQNPQRIPAAITLRLRSAPQVFLSAVTAWELAIKQSLGNLTMARPVSDLIRRLRLTELPVTVRHGEAVGKLPLHHRDPFDRLLIAQAMSEPMHLLTADPQFKPYSELVIQV